MIYNSHKQGSIPLVVVIASYTVFGENSMQRTLIISIYPREFFMFGFD